MVAPLTETPRFPHQVIRASAGTGKTYQLSNRFIGLVAAGTAAEQILAATFARKAAGEILDRVLTRLADAALDPDKLAELASAIGDPALDRASCLRLLRGLIRRLHRLRIGTLDSFFIKLAGSFSLELGLPPGWRIVDELADLRVRAEAIQTVLREESSSTLLTLVHLLSKGEASRSVTDQVANIVADLYGLYCETDYAAWHMLPLLKPLADEELALVLDGFEKLGGLPTSQIQGDHRKSWEHATSGNWQSFIETGIAGAILECKETFRRKPITAEMEAAYRPLIDHAQAVLRNQLAHQTESTHALLGRFDAVYRKLKAEQRAMRFDDVTRLLAQGLASGRIRDVSFRLDSLVAHLLLDEFQDTSLLQWTVVRPFAELVTAAGLDRSFFCVGDVKQAIYGWRGGESEIFDAVGEQLQGLEVRALTKSYRSSPVIIDMVNAVFDKIAGNKALDAFPGVAATWQAYFAELHSTAKVDLAGYSRMVVAPLAAEGEKQDHCTLTFAAAEVARLTREAPGRSVGVLVRRNSAVARLIYELRSRHQVRASEEGGNPLTDSNGVQLILSLLRLADHPGDTTARFHVARSPLGEVVGLKRFDDPLAAQKLAAEIRQDLLAAGYGKTIYGWVQGLAPACDERELSRLLQLVELAYAYESDASLRPGDFVELVETRRVEDPSSANVRVMTVHQAKGLEFDIVVLPELDGRLAGNTVPSVVIGRERATAPVERVCRYANAAVQSLLPPEFQKLFEVWPKQKVNESLCLLYVALTRAAHALHLIVAPAKEGAKTWPKTFAGVLRSSLAADRAPNPGATLHERGDARWFAPRGGSAPAGSSGMPGIGAESTAGEPVVETITVTLRGGGPRRRGLLRQSPSGLQGAGAGAKTGHRQLKTLLRLDESLGADRGTLFHAWLEEVEWLDSGEPDDDTLQRIFRRLGGERLAWEKERADFRRLLSHAAIRQALSRATYEKPLGLGFSPELCRELQAAPLTLDVWRERSFAIREDDTLLQGTIDRVVLLRHGDQVIAADILDYKTDQVSNDAAIAGKVEEYRPQIEAYRRAVARLTGLDPSNIAARLLFTGPGVVRDVPFTAAR